MLPSPDHSGLGLRGNSYRGHLWVHFRCGPVTRSPSQGRLCRLASSASFPPRMQTQATGFRLFPRWDSPPTEHASLSLIALWPGNANEPLNQGLGKRLIVSDLISKTSGTIRRRERLGGMLNYYYRAAA